MIEGAARCLLAVFRLDTGFPFDVTRRYVVFTQCDIYGSTYYLATTVYFSIFHRRCVGVMPS